MKLYVNLYKVINPTYDTRIFESLLGELNIPSFLGEEVLNKFEGIIDTNLYVFRIDDYDWVLRLEKEIPKSGTVFNFVPNKIVED